MTRRNADPDRGTAARPHHAGALRAALDGAHRGPQRRGRTGRKRVDRVDGGRGGGGGSDRGGGVCDRVSKENIANTKK